MVKLLKTGEGLKIRFMVSEFKIKLNINIILNQIKVKTKKKTLKT